MELIRIKNLLVAKHFVSNGDLNKYANNKNYPAQMSFNEAIKFANRMSREEGLELEYGFEKIAIGWVVYRQFVDGYRLPTLKEAIRLHRDYLCENEAIKRDYKSDFLPMPLFEEKGICDGADSLFHMTCSNVFPLEGDVICYGSSWIESPRKDLRRAGRYYMPNVESTSPYVGVRLIRNIGG